MTGPHDPATGARTALGPTLRALRTSRQLTLRDLAALLEVSPATLSAIENGRTGVSADRVARLAALLGVPVGRMFLPADAQPPRDGTDPAAGHGGEPSAGGQPDGHPDWRSFPPLSLDTALRGALSCFLEFGYHGATMRTIAERANLSVAGLYHHYASKQDMLVALLDLTMTDLHTRSVAARAEGRSCVERFTLLVECLALVHTHRRELGFVGASEMRSLEPDARRRLAGVRQDQQRMVDVEVEQAVLAGHFLTTRPREAARAVVTMCTALPQWFRETGPATAEQVAEQYVQFALAVVGAVDGAPSAVTLPVDPASSR